MFHQYLINYKGKETFRTTFLLRFAGEDVRYDLLTYKNTHGLRNEKSLKIQGVRNERCAGDRNGQQHF